MLSVVPWQPVLPLGSAGDLADRFKPIAPITTTRRPGPQLRSRKGFPARVPIQVVALALAVAACGDLSDDDEGSTPSPIVSLQAGGSSLEFWPYTGMDRSGEREDPINLVFSREDDPLDLRDALLAVSGDRTGAGLPNGAPFDCTWEDTTGEFQTAFAEPRRWVAPPVELGCGELFEARFHVRLFDVGDWVIGNAHFETNLGVLSWELAERLVVADFQRSGILDDENPAAQTEIINESPYRAIPVRVYNLLSQSLRAVIGGPSENVTEPVAIASDGRATILNVRD